MEPRIEVLARESERLQMVTKYVEKCLESKFQYIDKETLCFLLGIEWKESEDNE